MKERKEFVKITFEDIEIAEEFFENSKHLDEFLCGVFDYYRGNPIRIKTKIVNKFFNTYKKTMDFIIESKESGKNGAKVRIDNQYIKSQTLEGVLEVPLEPSPQANKKEVIIKDKEKEETLDGKKREKEILTNQAEELYKLYPSQCEVKNRPTGKSSSDKEKLKRLIYTHGFDKVKGSINYYIESSKKSGSFISNFKTLLNNLPEVPEAEELKRNAKKWGQSSGKEEDYSMPKKTKVNYAN